MTSTPQELMILQEILKLNRDVTALKNIVSSLSNELNLLWKDIEPLVNEYYRNKRAERENNESFRNNHN